MIGHTRSGKPIYDSGNNAKEFNAHDHHDAAAAHNKFANYMRSMNPAMAKTHDQLSHHHESEAASMPMRNPYGSAKPNLRDISTARSMSSKLRILRRG